jgi:phosphoribosylaminoimidazolecarboxamide formyltransferase/IMP cyclohydrolase
MKIERALVSVYDKTGIVDFARELNRLDIKIIATDGTYRTLRESGIDSVGSVRDVTGFPEILDGRVKTEHPKLIGGILALRSSEQQMDELKRQGIEPIDMVVCNLYPFEKVVLEGADLRFALDSIDIGGPNMIRAAAKNFQNVVVVVSPDRYDQIIKELKKKRDIGVETRLQLAIEAFKLTARYDRAIHRFLEQQTLA